MFDGDHELERQEDAEDQERLVSALLKDIRDLSIIIRAIERIKKRHGK